MFTGIIETVALVAGIQKDSAGALLRVNTGFLDLELGESVAVNGVCLTVLERGAGDEPGVARFFVSRETLGLTNLSALSENSRVNLERALTLQKRLSGHIVQGHVDGLADFLGAREVVSDTGISYEVRFKLPANLGRYCVKKGSIAINGTSLTLNEVSGSEVSGSEVSIMLIPHSWKHTNLSALKPGDRVNVEVDLMAKYAEKLLCPN